MVPIGYDRITRLNNEYNRQFKKYKPIVCAWVVSLFVGDEVTSWLGQHSLRRALQPNQDTTRARL